MQTGTFYKTQAARRIRVTPDSRFDWYDVLNRAGVELLNARPWGNLLLETATLSATPGTDYIACPRGWTKVVTVAPESTGQAIEIVTPQRFEALRTRSDEAAGKWVLAPDTVPPESPDTTPRMGWRIHPTPTAAGEPTIRARGRRGWVNFHATNLELRPPLPPNWHQAYYLACMCVATETQDPSAGPSPDRALFANAVEALWQTEEDSEDDAGELRGGVDELTTPTDAFSVDWTSFP